MQIIKQIKWVVLFFAFFFALNTFIQDSYFYYQMKKNAETDINKIIDDLLPQVTPALCDIEKYDQIYTFYANEYCVVSKCGFLDVEGKFVHGLITQVKLLHAENIPKEKFKTITVEAGEWRIFIKSLKDGQVILGIDNPRYKVRADKDLKDDASLFGSTINEALGIHPNKTHRDTNYAVLDDFGNLRNAVGALPLSINESFFSNVSNSNLQEKILDNKKYLIFYRRIFDQKGELRGTIIIPKDIDFISNALSRHKAFNIVLSLISLIIFLSIWIYSLKKSEAEKIRIKEAFRGYFSPHIMETILKESVSLKPIGQPKEITVMFADIRNFTSIADQLSSTQLIDLLQSFFTAMTEEVFATDGVVDKFIGDSIMAFWGAPIDQPDQADRAVRTAISMMERLRKLQEKWNELRYPFVSMGIGISTGITIVGNIGSEKRFDYTVIGDEVNVAARLEELNKEHNSNIIISNSTRKRLSISVKLEDLGDISLRGITHPIRIYKVCI